MNDFEKTLKNEFKDKEYAHAYVDEFLNSSIATQIKVLREQRGWTQQQMAELTGMHQERISVLENINYSMWSISTLKKLAEAFDVTLNVSFEGFSNRINNISHFSRESLEILSREEDLSFYNAIQDSVVSEDIKSHETMTSDISKPSVKLETDNRVTEVYYDDFAEAA